MSVRKSWIWIFLVVPTMGMQVFSGSPRRQIEDWHHLPLHVELLGSIQKQHHDVHDALSVIVEECRLLLGDLAAERPTRELLYIQLDEPDRRHGYADAFLTEHWGQMLFRRVFLWWWDQQGLRAEPWLRQGLAELFSLKLGQDQAWMAPEETRSFVSRRVAHYFDRAGMESPHEAAQPWQVSRTDSFVRGAGFLAALRLNQRRLFESGACLRQAFTQMRAAVQRQHLLNRLGDDESLRPYIYHTRLLPVSSILEDEGWAMDFEPVAGEVRLQWLEQIPAE